MPVEVSTTNADGESQAITLLKQTLSNFETEHGRLQGLSFHPLAHDVVITTTPKAGTTWVQQICHQLRSAGDMEFDEISSVVPWLELAHDQGQDLSTRTSFLQPHTWKKGQKKQADDDSSSIRLFKTHCWADHCPPFQKTIVVIRHPEDVLLSFYRFFEGWFFEPGTISLDAFAHEFWLARGVPTSKMQNASYFVHLISWYKRRNDPGVLFVCFEDLKGDLAKQVARIATFLSTDQHRYDDPETIATAVAHSTFAFMKKHESQFDEHLSKLARNEACGLPKMAGMQASKLNEGSVGKGKERLSKEIKTKIWQKWKEVVEPVTGCVTYDDLRKQLEETSSS